MLDRFELTRSPWLKALLKSRLFPSALMLALLFFFVVAILAGFFGTPVHETFRLSNAGNQPLQILGEPRVELVEGC